VRVLPIKYVNEVPKSAKFPCVSTVKKSKMNKIMIGLFALLVTAASAYAQARTVTSGKSDAVRTHGRFDGNMVSHPITIDVTTPPTNGKVTTRIVQQPITSNECAAGDAKCAAKVGNMISKTQVIYTSRKGFVGSDTFTYTRTSTDASDRSNGLAVTINVQVN
jgi:hypothetical protein